MADTRPITRLTIKDTETGTETETDIKTCARGVECDEGKTVQDHISDFVAHKKDVNRHVLVQVSGDEPETGPALWFDDDNLLHYKDKDGNESALYPTTKPDNVEGLSALLTAAKQEAQTNLSSHTSDKSNPHGVTAEQAGADPSGSAAAVQTNLDTHTSNTSNPHNVTYSQVGAAAASHTHSSSDLTNAVPIYLGGTGATAAADAMTNLGGMLTDMSNLAFELVWTESEMLAGYWSSVCYGDGKFVATTSSGNKIAYSTDGITWTTATTSISLYGDSVCYGNGKFVAVAGVTASASYSTDGITWATTTMPRSANWQSVCYGAGKFVAVSDNNSAAAYSTDGVTWTEMSLSTSKQWRSVCYGAGKFVAIARNTNAAAYSTDGITWTAMTLPSSKDWKTVCYGGGKFVAVAKSSNAVAYSDDGINWTATTLRDSQTWYSVCYGNGKFVAVAYNSNIIAYSTNGTSWTRRTLPNGANWQSVCYGAGKFVAISLNSSSKASTVVADATPSAISQLNAAGLARMQLVSYVGTGTYGSSNPTSVTFDFAPKIVLNLFSSVAISELQRLIVSKLTNSYVSGNGFSGYVSGYPSYGKKSSDGKSIYWYNTKSASYQINNAGVTYYLLALA